LLKSKSFWPHKSTQGRREKKRRRESKKKSLDALQDSTELVCLSFIPIKEQGSSAASHMFRAGLLVLLVSVLFCFVLKLCLQL